MRAVSAILFAFAATTSGSASGQAAGQISAPAKPAARPAYDPSAPVDLPKTPLEVHVDQRCRILPDPNLTVPPGTRPPRPHRDGVVCHLEGVKSSSHVEEQPVAGKQKQTLVKVQEQEYVLQNVTAEPVIFFVEHPVPKDWQTDSDPPPVSLVPLPSPQGEQVALFRVNADPGQIVRLHVGIRHTWPKPKPVPVPASTPAATPNPPTAPNSAKPA